MVEAKKQYGFSVSAVYTLFISLSVICIVIGCSSKKDEKDKSGAEKSRPAKTDANISSIDKAPQLPKSPILPLPDANRTAKKTKTPREDVTPTAALLREYNKAGSSERKIQVLRYLPDAALGRDPCSIAMALTAVEDKDANVALAGIELVQGCRSPDVLPVAAKAMSHTDEEVRRMAIGVLSDIDDPQTGDLLVAALSDDSNDVREAALDTARDKDEQIQFKVFEKGISCSYGDTKEASVDMLEQAGGRRAMDILIEALRDKDAEFREKVASSINTLIDKEFASYEEAKTWWEKNRGKYDEDLSLK
jgi:HEAT repeat protein